MDPTDHGKAPDRRPAESDPDEARTPPARPDERGSEPERTAAAAAAAERGGGTPGGSRGTSAESPEEIAGRPGTTQHVPEGGVPPGAERREPRGGGGT